MTRFRATRWLSALTLFAAGQLPAEAAGTQGKLPPSARPVAYRVHVAPDIAKRTFAGSVAITLDVPRPTANFTLNALELTVGGLTVDGRPSRGELRTDNASQRLDIHLPCSLAAGRHVLGLRFNGKLSETPRGLYLQPYQEHGQARTMLASQFEAVDARRLFPLWDEPGMRARFQLAIDVPQAFMAVSNMPVARTTPLAHGLKRVDFQATPPMASYLMVLTAGELEAIGRRVAGVDLRVVTTRGKRESGRYALDVLAKILPYYNDYFGVRYPLPKLDLIAIPGGDSGAMENWGGIIFQDGVLLYDPRLSSERDREAIFEFLAHEVAHQWFGNLVTMAWWDDLWLNEGFADWMETKCTAHFNPTWPVWLDIMRKRNRALSADALRTTHPVQQPIADATQADAAFDLITYDKGQGVIRMLESAMGPDAFRAGIRRYMKAHAYGNARTADLWDVLARSTKLPVKRIAPAWIKRAGSPLVSAALEHGQVKLEQGRLLPDGVKPIAPWPLPLTYRVGARQRSTLFDRQHATLPGGSGSLLVGPGAEGFFRVAYAPAEAAALRSQVRKLAPIDQIALMDDAWALIAAGKSRPEDALALWSALAAQADTTVWTDLVAVLDDAASLARASVREEAIDAGIVRALQPLVARYGYAARPGDKPVDLQLRNRCLDLLAQLNEPATMAAARERFGRLERLSGDERTFVLTAIGHHGTPAETARLWELAAKADGFEEKRQYYVALADNADPNATPRVLDTILNGSVSPELGTAMLRHLARQHANAARQFVAQHHAQLTSGRPPIDQLEIVSAAYFDASDRGAGAVFLDQARGLPKELDGEIDKVFERLNVRSELAARVNEPLAAWAAGAAGK